MASRQLKILVDARNIGTSTGRYMQRLVSNLEKIDRKNVYKVIVKPSERTIWKPGRSNFRQTRLDITEYTYGEQIGLLRYLRKQEADLVHFTLPQHPIFYWRPFVITIHDLTMINFVNKRQVNLASRIIKYWLKPKLFKFVIWHGVKFSKYIIVPSKNTKQDILRQFKVSPNKIVVTYESADKLATSAKPVRPLQDKKYLLYVGNAFPYKNLERMIEAFQLVREKHPYLQLVLAGKEDYFYQQLKSWVIEKNHDGVVFAGFVSDSELSWLYQNARLYVFSSLSEGFGLPGLEAMQYDLPVVAAKATSLPEIYGQAALYFDPNNTADMARVINRVLGDTKIRRRLVVNARSRRQEFSWERMARQTLDIYKKATAD